LQRRICCATAGRAVQLTRRIDSLHVIPRLGSCATCSSTDGIEQPATKLSREYIEHEPDSIVNRKHSLISAIGNSVVKCAEVVSLLKFYLVCPASSASAERSFSQLRRLKSYLRSTMSQRRLNSLLVLSTYTDELEQLDMQLLLEDFITRNDFRRHTCTFALSKKSH